MRSWNAARPCVTPPRAPPLGLMPPIGAGSRSTAAVPPWWPQAAGTGYSARRCVTPTRASPLGLMPTIGAGSRTNAAMPPCWPGSLTPLALSEAVRIESERIVAVGVHVRLAVEAEAACELRAGGAVAPPAAARAGATALVIVAVLAQVALLVRRRTLMPPLTPQQLHSSQWRLTNPKPPSPPLPLSMSQPPAAPP